MYYKKMVDQQVTTEFIQRKNVPNGQGLLMTRLKPPRQQARLLARPRIDALLKEAVNYPLTVVVTPAGCGKTTALAGFAMQSDEPVSWCRMTDEDDPSTLLHHLVAAFRSAGILEDDRIYAKMVSLTSIQAALELLVNELAGILTTDTLLVLDDYHRVDEKPDLRAVIEYLISIQPEQLHLILSTRSIPMLASLSTNHARGELYKLEQVDLAFTPTEVEELFALYGYTFSDDISRLTMLCRGWPLVLQLMAADKPQCAPAESEHTSDPHEAEKQATTMRQADLTGQGVSIELSSCLTTLQPLIDEYLARHVFDVQPPELQEFLLRTAELRWFDSGVCDALPSLAHLTSYQDEVFRRCLFLEPVRQGQFAYQPLFHMFLDRLAQQRLNDWREIHTQAADYYRAQEDHANVMFHLLEIGEDAQAADVLMVAAGEWVKQGQAMELLTWLGRLPDVYQNRPYLLEARAAACRQLGHFEESLRSYQRAEAAFQEQHNLEGQARALRGRAEVYLDTVQPAPAEELLDQAFSLLPEDKRIERAEILLLQAENWANRGRADIAFQLETRARMLAQEEIQQEQLEKADQSVCVLSPVPSLPPRLLLRSGRLNESRRLLEAELGLRPQHPPVRRSRMLAHREPLLLLALLYTLLGNGARALAMALRGLIEAQQQGSPLTEGIAHMRVGHAFQVITPLDAAAAQRHYQEALELVESFGVTRTKVEGLMGLVLLHGLGGNLVEAETIAQEGLQIAESAGDEWITAMIWLGLGGSAVAVSDERGIAWLDHAFQRFVRGDDSYGQAVVELWRALWYLRTGPDDELDRHVARLLDLTRTNGYEGLLSAPTLFGPRDMAMLIPVLLRRRSLSNHTAFVQKLLRQAFPTIAADETVEDYHPGYTLRIHMLGSFRVWRGSSEIQAREWQREKARQLLQLLLTYRGQWLQREQICAWLWPDNDLDAAERQFKVTLNALNTALEPYRPPRTTPFFVRRQGLAYSFAPSYGCWIDVDEFELRTTNIPQGDPDFVLRNAQAAVNLYQGDYLAESLYDSWTLEERERLLARYLATATVLADRLLEKGDIEHAIEMCERVLRRDRCYEEAYQVLMRAYAHGGSRSQALRSYARCVQALQDDLGIDPLPETTLLYEQIKRNEKV
jgi:DNA-binding SARP family transcriptional activator